jgi:hypothetical protein
MEPIYAALERGEKINIYFEPAGDFHGLDLGALWQDVQAAGSIGLKHRSSWKRMKHAPGSARLSQPRPSRDR